MLKKTITLNLLVVLVFNVLGQVNIDYQFKQYSIDNDTLLYRIFFPLHFDSTVTYPLIVFLHGAGERGTDNESQLVHGSHFFSSPENQNETPAIVIFPQCPKGDYWAQVAFSYMPDSTRIFKLTPHKEPTRSMSLLINLINSYKQKPWINPSRIYVGGLSMGGMGTFEILFRQPQIFAAGFSICGGGDPSTAATLVGTPLWIFHGAVDEVVPVEFSIQMADAIKNKGGEVQLTIYPQTNHNAWDSVFVNKDLLPWLFSHSKSK